MSDDQEPPAARPPEDLVSRTLYGEVRELASQRIRSDAAARSISATDFAHDILARALQHRALQDVPRSEVRRRVARIAREVLIDHARARMRIKRGEGVAPERWTLEPAAHTGLPQIDLLALQESLEKLERVAPREAEILELRYFAGMEMEQIAEVLEVSKSTVEKDARRALARVGDWLKADA